MGMMSCRRIKSPGLKRRWILLAALGLLCPDTRAEMRTWTTLSGKTFEGEYANLAFDNVTLKDSAGKMVKVPFDQLSPGDRNYVEYANPPKLDIDFLESSKQVFVKASPLWADNSPITVLDYNYGARIKQTDSRIYNHELTVEWYRFSVQVWDPSKYKMVQKYRSKPIVFDKHRREYELRSKDKVRLIRIVVDQGTGAALPRGQKDAENIVLVRDERGEVIAYKSSKKWLYEHLDRLEKLPVGAWLNDECIRTHPSSPPPLKLGYMPGDY